LAFWMTACQPQYNFKSDLNLEDVDMVIMMDTSGHLGHNRKGQVDAVKAFSGALFEEVSGRAASKRRNVTEGLLDLKYKHLSWLQNFWTPTMNYDDESQIKWADDNIYQSRGYLRIATGTFNANFFNKEGASKGIPALIHPPTYKQEEQVKYLDEFLKRDVGEAYQGHSQWHSAMDQCKIVLEEATKLGTKLEEVDPIKNKRLGKRCWKPGPLKNEKGEYTEKHCHEFTSEAKCPSRYCKWELDGEDYKCQEGPPLCRRQFCIIIGDSDAMCKRRGVAADKYKSEADQTRELAWSKQYSTMCKKAKHGVSVNSEDTSLCPNANEFGVYGSPLEWKSEMDDCSEFYAKRMLQTDADAARSPDGVWDINKLNEKEDIKLIMMFMINSDREEQLKLEDDSLKEFIRKGLSCEVGRIKVKVEPEAGQPAPEVPEMKEIWKLSDDCNQFILARDFETLGQQAERVAQLLKSDTSVAAEPNADKDYRYLFFLILPLNLIFYLCWTWIIRWYSQVQTQIDKMAGKKKKMIKVTKSLVEKEEETQTPAAIFDLEMAEVEKLKIPIEYGSVVTVRARLKGGYIRTKDGPNNKDILDGNGKPFEMNSFFTFEPMDPALRGYPVESGVPFRIKDSQGDWLKITDNGAIFVPQPEEDGSCEFCMEPFSTESLEDDDPAMDRVHMGEMGLIRCNATGQFLKISKEGDIDGTGDRKNAECQVVVDGGGMPLTTGSIVTMRTDEGDVPVHCTPQGLIRVGLEGDEECYQGHAGEWVYWLLEKKPRSILQQMEEPLGGVQGFGDEAAPSSGGGAVAVGPSTAAGADTNEGEGECESIPSEDDEDGGGDEAPGVAIQMRFSMAKEAPIVKRASTMVDPRMNSDILHEGDIITLRALNTQYLQVDGKKDVDTGKFVLSSNVSGSKEGNPQLYSKDFMVHKMGVNSITKHNNVIRRGDKVCLRPIKGDDKNMKNHLRVNDDEDSVIAQGTMYDKEIIFTFEAHGFTHLVDPLSDALHRGDCEISYSPLWDKKAINKCEAMSAAWCKEEDLTKISGAVIVASGTTYTVPKGKQGWVAVVEDGVDVYKAAAQLKSQGATGLIIRCDNPCEMERLALGADPKVPPPVLPAVFVEKSLAEGLNEKGLTLKGCEFRKKYVTDVMRAIGRAPVTKGKVANTEIFNAAAVAMLEREKEMKIWKEQELERQRMQELREQVEESGEGGDKFRWKVNTNTHYMWGSSKMKVDYGKKAPPSAHKDKKVGADGKVIEGTDAGTHRHTVNRASLLKTTEKRTRLSVVVVDGEDFQKKSGHKLDLGDVGEVLTAEEAADQALEELSEESDFRIDYKFEEIEVDIDAAPEELGEDEEMMTEGQEQVKIGVPKKKFWMVGVGLAISTLLLLVILIAVMSKKEKLPPRQTDEDAMQDIFAPPADFDHWVFGKEAVDLHRAYFLEKSEKLRNDTLQRATAESAYGELRGSKQAIWMDI